MANVKVRMLTRQGTILSSRNVSFIKIIIYYFILFLKNSVSAEIENLKQDLYLVIWDDAQYRESVHFRS